jgi:hypothetical protein
MTLVEACARAMCGKDVEWRDCETACMQANRCASDGYKAHLKDARAVIPIVLAEAAKVALKHSREGHPSEMVSRRDQGSNIAVAICALGEGGL